jgi:hypothetical protein
MITFLETAFLSRDPSEVVVTRDRIDVLDLPANGIRVVKILSNKLGLDGARKNSLLTGGWLCDIICCCKRERSAVSVVFIRGRDARCVSGCCE